MIKLSRRFYFTPSFSVLFGCISPPAPFFWIKLICLHYTDSRALQHCTYTGGSNITRLNLPNYIPQNKIFTAPLPESSINWRDVFKSKLYCPRAKLYVRVNLQCTGRLCNHNAFLICWTMHLHYFGHHGHL